MSTNQVTIPGSMNAWRLNGLGGTLSFEKTTTPVVRSRSALVRIEAAPLLSYLKDYVAGKLTFYHPPEGKFTPGTNAVGVIEAVGPDVWHLKPGQRVLFSPHLVANENVADPAQILIGWTAFGAGATGVQADWRDGSLAEYALAPVETLTPVDGLESIGSVQLAMLNRFIVPYGGMLRGRLAAGETLVVNGASGAYGAASVLLGIAMGAGRVIAAGRNKAALDAVVQAGGSRVTAVQLTGDVATDAQAIRTAAAGPVDMAFDMVGQASDTSSTLASLQSLKRGGRLVLMGSMTVPLTFSYSDIMRNNREIIGQFMYPADAYSRLVGLLRAGLLNINAIRPVVFDLGALPAAMEAATTVGSLECVVVRP